MRAVPITRFGGPDVLDIVDIPEPVPGLGPGPGPGQKRYAVSTAGVKYADMHQRWDPLARTSDAGAAAGRRIADDDRR
jgi:NADPH:quinone reductase-like Zn-dependent oxidoreductase